MLSRYRAHKWRLFLFSRQTIIAFGDRNLSFHFVILIRFRKTKKKNKRKMTKKT